MMQKRSNRSERVSSEIKKILSEYFVTDPHSYDGFDLKLFSVTEVVASSCLQTAQVFVTYFAKDVDEPQILDFLSSLKPKLRHQLANNLRLKFVPDLRFQIDKTLDYAAKIDALIEKTHAGSELPRA